MTCLSSNGRIATDKLKDIEDNVIHDNKIKSRDGFTTETPANTPDVPNVIITTTEVPQREFITEILDEYNQIDAEEEESGSYYPRPKKGIGPALILTPYLKDNRTLEARNACRVNPERFMGLESYSGYITVNETYNSNIFFWYFPVEKRPINKTPWIIWLQGGPGASSMTGLFDEIGPFTYDVSQQRLRRK